MLTFPALSLLSDSPLLSNHLAEHAGLQAGTGPMLSASNSSVLVAAALQACMSRLLLEAHWPALLLLPADARLLPTESPVLQVDPWRAEGHAVLAGLVHASRSQVAVGMVGSEAELGLLLSLLTTIWKYGRLVIVVERTLSRPAVTRILAQRSRMKCIMVIYSDSQCPELCNYKDKDPLAGRNHVLDIYSQPPMINVRDDWRTTGLRAVSGVFGNMYPVLAKAANFTVHLHLSRFERLKCEKQKNILKSRTINAQVFSELLEGKFDITINQLVRSIGLPLHMEVSMAFFHGCADWFVPSARLASPLVHLALPLQPSAWLGVLGALAVSWLAARLLGRMGPVAAGLHALATLLGSSASAPRAMPRLALISLRLGCLVLACAYQSKLASILTVPFYEAQIDTAADIANSNLRIGMPCSANSFFVQQEDLLAPGDPVRRIIPRIEIIERFDKAIEMVSRRELAFLGATLPVMFSLTQLERGRELVYLRRRCVVSSPVGFLLRRGDPRVGRINELVARVLQAGLVTKWHEDAVLGMHLQQQASVPAQAAVTLKHLAGAFVALGVGWAAALLAGIAELLQSALENRRSSRRIA